MGVFSAFGSVFLLSGALILCKVSFGYYDRLSACYGDFLRLLCSIRQKIGTSSLSISQILDADEGYTVLGNTQFFAVAKKKGLCEAFMQCENNLPVREDDKRMLERYFSQFGSDMLAAELENLNDVIERLDNKRKQIEAEAPSKKRITSTMIVCGFLMIIILIV